MIQLSRLPRCYARAEGDTSTGPKSSYRKVGTVRTLRTITGGPLRRLEDLAAGLRRRLSGAPLATKHANLAGCLLVQSTEARPPNRNAAFSRAGSGYGGAASAGAFGFPGDRRFSVGSGTPLDSLWMPLLLATAFPTLGGDRQNVRVDRHVDVTIRIDLIVLRIRRRSNCGDGQTSKGRGPFQKSAAFRPLSHTCGSGTLTTGGRAARRSHLGRPNAMNGVLP